MKKGFTLIELLAVIVILAIIALIATPIVLNIIKDSRESAQLRSAEMYLDAVEQSISVEKMNNPNFNPNTCTITEEGNLLCDNTDILDIKIDGNKPVNGSITFEKGKIKNVTLEYGNDKVIIMNTKGELQYQNYISINNYQHKHTNGSIEDHNVTFDENGHGTCSKCMEEVLASGLYAEDGTLTMTWQELIDAGNISVSDGVLSKVGTFSCGVYDSNDLSGKLVIDKSVTAIGNSAFGIYHCPHDSSKLTEIIIPESVTNIGDSAFARCENLQSITIPSSVKSISNYTFVDCKGLETVILSNGVKSIGEYSFSGCLKLKVIELPNTIESIGESAFSGCSSLKSITIPESVTNIGEYILYNCKGLESIIVDENNKTYDSRNNCNALIETSTNTIISGCKNTVIPNSVTNIGSLAFAGCTDLTSITIPGSVKNTGRYAFRDCTELKSLTIENGVTSIGVGSFSGCTSLSEIILPNTIKTLETQAFMECTGLKSITIPDSVTTIDGQAFHTCTSLNTIYIPSSVTTISNSSSSNRFQYNNTFYDCSSSLKIYVGATSKQSGWGSYWNNYSDSGKLSVTYGVTREQYETNYKK